MLVEEFYGDLKQTKVDSLDESGRMWVKVDKRDASE